jgi:hypothetical protein
MTQAEVTLAAAMIASSLGIPQTPTSVTDALNVIEDWSTFPLFCKRHGLMPLFSDQDMELLSQHMPTELYRRLSVARQNRLMLAMRNVGCLHKAHRCLTEAGLIPIAVKGPALAGASMGSPLRRDSVDLDILIAPDQVTQANAALIDAGFQALPDLRDLTDRQRATLFWRDNACAYRYQNVTVELHWRLFSNPHLMDVSFAEIVDSARSIDVMGQQITMLDGDVLFAYLVVHGARHHWANLKWLVDVAAMMQNDPGVAERVISSIEPRALAPLVFAALRLCGDIFGTAQPDQHLLSKAAWAKAEHHYATGAWGLQIALGAQARNEKFQKARLALREIGLSPGLRYQARQWARWTTNPQDWQDVKLPDVAFPLYFPLRPILWLGRLIRAQR